MNSEGKKMATKGSPRKYARELISFTLARLHKSLSLDERRQALERARPEGYRRKDKQGWYADVWDEEVKRALAEAAKPQAAATVEKTPAGVRCGWCGYPKSPGCSVCYRDRTRYEQEKEKNDTGVI
jgi:hypothetical protein